MRQWRRSNPRFLPNRNQLIDPEYNPLGSSPLVGALSRPSASWLIPWPLFEGKRAIARAVKRAARATAGGAQDRRQAS